jgi:carbamate kinase
MTRIVIALGGNALLRRGEPPEADVQQRNIAVAAAAIAAIAEDRSIVITHGNGPQVGLLALQAAALRDAAPYPLDMLGAESEGLIGYLIERELANCLPGRQIATLLTQVEVDPGDPAFRAPNKPIGPVYEAAAAQRLAAERGWTLAPDGEFVRRVVPSPEPRRILELPTIRLLLDAGVIVICAGGGGIPVAVDKTGAIRGVEAVIDKDLAAALLAIELNATRLLLLTDVPAVYLDWPRPARRAIRLAAPDVVSPQDFAAGSMRPKVEAARRFAIRTGCAASIGALEDAAAILARTAGTTIAVGGGRLVLYPPDGEAA